MTRRKDGQKVKRYVTNPANIVKHRFTPLIHRTVLQRKFRPKSDTKKGKIAKKRKRFKSIKEREIFFCSHLDSIIYGYYSHLLTIQYEKFMSDKEYGQVAVAYRKIPLSDGSSKNKSNIEFALEAFQFIEKNKHRKLSIIVADVTSFFDNLDHAILKKQWKEVLDVNDLPDDHYAVYKNLIYKRYVNEYDLFKRFQGNLIIERYKPNDKTQTEFKRKRVNNIHDLRRERVVAFCDKAEFFDKAVDLIRRDRPNSKKTRIEKDKPALKGIPQGTPISATLANIYMLDFDEEIFKEVTEDKKNGYYQRYSDDLIVICDSTDEEYFYELIKRQIEEISKLEIQRKKTNVYRYGIDKDGNFTGGLLEHGVINQNKQLEYLGFRYDGNKVLVKSAGFSKFYRSMKRSFRRGAHYAKKANIPSDSLYERRLYKRFTHVGSHRRMKWKPDPENPTAYKRTSEFDWGNFISYLNKANEVMKAINKDDSIKNQYSKVWSNFHKVKSKTKNDIGIE